MRRSSTYFEQGNYLQAYQTLPYQLTNKSLSQQYTSDDRTTYLNSEPEVAQAQLVSSPTTAIPMNELIQSTRD